MLISSNYSKVNAANCTAPGGDGFAKIFRVGKSAAHGDAVKRGRIVGQDGFAFKTPAAQNAFDAAELAVVVNEQGGIFGRESLVFAGTFQGFESVRFMPTVGEAVCLGDEFSVH